MQPGDTKNGVVWHPMAPPRFRQAFTLVELLAAVAVIAVLGALLLPTLSRIKAKADSATCQSNLRQLGISMNLYAVDHNQTFPVPANHASGLPTWYQTLSREGYLESRKILRCPAGNYGTDSGSPLSYTMTDLPIWYPPSYRRTGEFPNFFTQKLNNPSQWPLLMDGDTPRVFSLENPQETSPVRERFAARHGGKANVLMADGHIESVSYGDTRWSQRNLNTNNLFNP